MKNIFPFLEQGSSAPVTNTEKRLEIDPVHFIMFM